MLVSLSRYSSTKLIFWPKLPKVVCKNRVISRERQLLSKIWFDIQNLRYFLSDCPTIILWHFVFRVQICDKTWYFSCIFGWFLVNILTTPFEQYWSNLDKSETKGYKAGAEGCMVEFSVKSVKIDQIRPKLMGNPKKILWKVSGWSNSRKNQV